MDKDLNRHLAKEDVLIVNKLQYMLASYTIRELQIETTWGSFVA